MEKSSEILWQDEQHQRLFQIIDEIEAHVTPSLLTELKNYIDYHFSLEEKYMTQFDYPQAEAHKRSHKHFNKKVYDLIDANPVLNKETGVELSSLLNTWLKEHVFGIDKEFEKYFVTFKNHNFL